MKGFERHISASIKPLFRMEAARFFLTHIAHSSNFLLLIALWGSIVDSTGSAYANDGDLNEAPAYQSTPYTSGIKSPYDQEPSTELTVDTASKFASILFYDRSGEDLTGAPMVWTGDHGSCDAGATSQQFRDNIFRRINFYRAYAGVPAIVEEVPNYTSKAQEAALMMSRNNALSHTPPVSWECYTTDGYEAAGKSDLYLGVSGVNAIDGYIRDPGANNMQVGHRNWILDVSRLGMGTGDVSSADGYRTANALWVVGTSSGRSDTRNGFVAWPPSGYIPYPIIYPRWSFKYPGGDLSNATVSLTKNGQPVSILTENVPTGTWYPLVWIPTGLGIGATDYYHTWSEPDDDEIYQVTVSNILVGGIPTEVTYTVTIFIPEFTLSDVIRSLDVLVGGDAESSFMDVNGDNLFGAAEIIYMLQHIVR